jgi:hypothetical protein
MMSPAPPSNLDFMIVGHEAAEAEALARTLQSAYVDAKVWVLSPHAISGPPPFRPRDFHADTVHGCLWDMQGALDRWRAPFDRTRERKRRLAIFDFHGHLTTLLHQEALSAHRSLVAGAVVTSVAAGRHLRQRSIPSLGFPVADVWGAIHHSVDVDGLVERALLEAVDDHRPVRAALIGAGAPLRRSEITLQACGVPCTHRGMTYRFSVGATHASYDPLVEDKGLAADLAAADLVVAASTEDVPILSRASYWVGLSDRCRVINLASTEDELGLGAYLNSAYFVSDKHPAAGGILEVTSVAHDRRALMINHGFPVLDGLTGLVGPRHQRCHLKALTLCLRHPRHEIFESSDIEAVFRKV